MDGGTATILEALRGLPQQELTATMRNPRSEADRTFVGAMLFDYAVATGMLEARTETDGLADGYLVLAAADGQRVAVAFAEIWPGMTSKRALLAHTQDGAPVRDGVRLVVTGDHLSGRSLGGIVRIEAKRAPAGVARDADSALELSGLLDHPATVAMSALSARPVVSIETRDTIGHGGRPLAPRRYRGVRVYDLLDDAGIRLDPAVNEDFLSKIIVVRSADGRPVVLAGGELEPRFMAGHAIIATQREDAAENSGLRLIVPFDRKPGRWAKQVVSIELREG